MIDMALMICPECQREMSDTLKACPHCGFSLSSDAETASSFSSESNPPASAQAASFSAVKSNRTVKILIVSLIALVVIAAAIFFIVKTNQAKSRADYIEHLNQTKIAILNGAADAESLGNLISAVWHDAIFEDYDSKTVKYVKENGSYLDFNVAIKNLFADETTKDAISKMKENQSVVEAYIKDLQNPPKDLVSCYETLDDLYSAYLDLTNLVISPTGSLKTFNEDFRKSDTDVITNYDKLNALIPEE